MRTLINILYIWGTLLLIVIVLAAMLASFYRAFTYVWGLFA